MFLYDNRYGIRREMLQYMAKSFISTVQPTLTEIDAWNPEVSSAWEQLFEWITFGLESGFIVTKPTDGAITSETATASATASVTVGTTTAMIEANHS